MSKTTESVTPRDFLAALRHTFPQFAEQSRATGAKLLMGGLYAQQGEHATLSMRAYTHFPTQMRKSVGSK